MIRKAKIVINIISLFCILLMGYINFGENGYLQLFNIVVKEWYLSSDVTINNVVYHENQSIYSAMGIYKYSIVNTGYGKSFLLESKYLKPNRSISGVKNIKCTDTKITGELEKVVSILPKNVVNSLNSNGWGIESTTEDLTKLCGLNSSNSDVVGLTLYEDNCIKLKEDKDVMELVICHEVGHYLDKVCNSGSYLSDSEQWIRIYEKEKDTAKFLCSNKEYSISTPKEYFAECINQTILFPELISKSMPMSYYYCLACIHSI